MKAPSTPVLAGFAAAAVLATLVLVGAPHDRPAPAPSARPTAEVAPASVSGGGFTLASAAIELPADAAHFPSGAAGDTLTANCTACHSASMVLAQPPLKPEQWQATVKKMREVYKAPIAERDEPAILAALSTLKTP